MPLNRSDPIPLNSPDLSAAHLADLTAAYPEIMGGEWAAPRNAAYLDDLRAYYVYDTSFDVSQSDIVDASITDSPVRASDLLVAGVGVSVP